jgi:phosphoribosylformylglycinamidine synthase II
MMQQQLSNILDFSSLSESAILALLAQYQLNLTPEEALTIQERLLKRPPTLAECVLWSIQGSEHCSYKSSRKHLQQFITDGPHVILGPKEDAGIIAVAQDHQGKRYGIVISHESHNHPSQIVPYEGAATGVGGNVRDVCCMGAEVIAVADSLRFGDINRPKTHWIHQGVVNGIGGYGNPLGVPNIAGDIYYDAAYNENCLVTVVTLGIVREDHIIHSYAPKEADQYVFILVGKPTDNSGFGGASFASSNLEANQEEKNKGAVQEPNAFLQRHLLKANYALFKQLQEKNLIHRVGFKDLGAGGIACASVELAEAGGYGAEINLDHVPVDRQDISPTVVLCAETQERFMWVVPPDLVDMILTHYNHTFALPSVSQGAKAAVIGHIRTDGLYVVKSQGETLVSAAAKDITKGIVYDRHYILKSFNPVESVESVDIAIQSMGDLNQILLSLLRHENIASRAAIFETYDKQVQGRTILEAGWADAGVMQPFNDESYPEEIRQVGIALSLDHNPRYNKIDPYWGAVNAVVEAVRNVTAAGANPLAITDCLCFGNPTHPEQMGELVQSIKGIADACFAIKLKEYPEASLPVVAGNVSLYNESAQGAIPPSPMIACLGVLPEVSRAMTYSLKRSDTLLVLVGARKDECGGSVYYQLHNELGSALPQPDLPAIAQEIHAVSEAISAGLILAAHDISDGGIAVALAEMSFKNQIGLHVHLPGELRKDKQLFSETGGFILEVLKDKWHDLNAIFAAHQVPIWRIGETCKEPRLRMQDVIDISIQEAESAWNSGLRERLI